jgi:hypothetical protein
MTQPRKRKNFSKKTLADRFAFCGGRCEGTRLREDGTKYRCNVVLVPGRWHGDHDNPDGLTGEPIFENCRALCLDCHAVKTPQDQSNIAKAVRVEANTPAPTAPRASLQPGRKNQGGRLRKGSPQSDRPRSSADSELGAPHERHVPSRR